MRLTNDAQEGWISGMTYAIAEEEKNEDVKSKLKRERDQRGRAFKKAFKLGHRAKRNKLNASE